MGSIPEISRSDRGMGEFRDRNSNVQAWKNNVFYNMCVYTYLERSSYERWQLLGRMNAWVV